MASSTKQHIVTALDEGIDAGFDSWYESLVTNTNDGKNGLPQLRTLLADVKKVGKKRGRPVNRAKQIEFYCNKYADDLAAVTTTPEPTPTTTTDVSALIIAAVQAGATPEQIAAIVAGSNGSVVTVTEDDIEDEDEPETCPPFTGNDPDAPCSSGQLYGLVQRGLIECTLTKGEAHEAIWNHDNA